MLLMSWLFVRHNILRVDYRLLYGARTNRHKRRCTSSPATAINPMLLLLVLLLLLLLLLSSWWLVMIRTAATTAVVC